MVCDFDCGLHRFYTVQQMRSHCVVLLFAGGFYGKWAVCFTYGAWFGVEGLLAVGEVCDVLPCISLPTPHL